MQHTLLGAISALSDEVGYDVGVLNGVERPDLSWTRPDLMCFAHLTLHGSAEMLTYAAWRCVTT